MYIYIYIHNWLVVWNMFFLYIGNHDPNWLSYFSKGFSTTNQTMFWPQFLLDFGFDAGNSTKNSSSIKAALDEGWVWHGLAVRRRFESAKLLFFHQGICFWWGRIDKLNGPQWHDVLILRQGVWTLKSQILCKSQRDLDLGQRARGNPLGAESPWKLRLTTLVTCQVLGNLGWMVWLAT